MSPTNWFQSGEESCNELVPESSQQRTAAANYYDWQRKAKRQRLVSIQKKAVMW